MFISDPSISVISTNDATYKSSSVYGKNYGGGEGLRKEKIFECVIHEMS